MKRHTDINRALLLMIVVLVSMIAIAGPVDKKVALIWGNSQYDSGWDRLPMCINDADTIEKIFKSLGYKTIILKNGTRNQMGESLKEFHSISRGSDVAVFFYSGHAIYINNSYYLVPVNAAKGGGSITNEYFPADDITSVMLDSVAISFLFYDACRDNVVIKESGPSKGYGNLVTPRNIAPALNDGRKPFGCMICYATEFGNKTDSKNVGRLSPFTKVLADHLSYSDEFRYLWDDIKTQVLLLTDYKQYPSNDNLYTGDFIFNKNGKKLLEKKLKAKIKDIRISTNAPNSKIRITIDGEEGEIVYSSDEIMKLEIGKKYQYRIEAEDYEPFNGTLDVKANTENIINVSMSEKQKAYLEVKGTRGASVRFDGQYKGEIPLTINTYSGSHSLEVSKKGFNSNTNTQFFLLPGFNSHTENLSKKMPWFLDNENNHDPINGISYLFSPEYQIGIDFFHIVKNSRFSIGFNLAFSPEFFRSHYNETMEFSNVVSSSIEWLDDEIGAVRPYNYIVTTIKGCPDVYSEEIDPNHEVKKKYKSFMFMVSPGYRICNGLLLQAGLGVSGNTSMLYMPHNYIITKEIYTDRISNALFGEPKYEIKEDKGDHWYNKKDYKISPSARLCLKIFLPVRPMRQIVIGGGYSYIFLNKNFSSWDVSLGFAFGS